MIVTPNLFGEIRTLIEDTKKQVAITVNASLAMLYWNIGKRINEEVLLQNKADYGKQVVASLSKQLTESYGSGWSQRHLFYCIKFAEVFYEKEILHTLCAKLSWSHIRLIINMEDSLKRMFYIEMCSLERWSVRQFQERIQSMLFERTAISKKSEETIKNELSQLKNEQKISADLVFRDPYFLDFLGLKDTFSEKDLETAIIAELQRFITEMGNDFAFMARQKRITIDNRDYKIDLLFYHRRLKCLVVIDLKIGEFDAAHKGQMELYLRFLENMKWLKAKIHQLG